METGCGTSMELKEQQKEPDAPTEKEEGLPFFVSLFALVAVRERFFNKCCVPNEP
jgi:hypothetical protein